MRNFWLVILKFYQLNVVRAPCKFCRMEYNRIEFYKNEWGVRGFWERKPVLVVFCMSASPSLQGPGTLFILIIYNKRNLVLTGELRKRVDFTFNHWAITSCLSYIYFIIHYKRCNVSKIPKGRALPTLRNVYFVPNYISLQIKYIIRKKIY